MTPTEKLYLEKFFEKGELTTRELMDLYVPPERTALLVLTHIKNLRRKLPPGYEIQTVRGKGYRLIPTSTD